jgi:hypothetical protein
MSLSLSRMFRITLESFKRKDEDKLLEMVCAALNDTSCMESEIIILVDCKNVPDLHQKVSISIPLKISCCSPLEQYFKCMKILDQVTINVKPLPIGDAAALTLPDTRCGSHTVKDEQYSSWIKLISQVSWSILDRANESSIPMVEKACDWQQVEESVTCEFKMPSKAYLDKNSLDNYLQGNFVACLRASGDGTSTLMVGVLDSGYAIGFESSKFLVDTIIRSCHKWINDFIYPPLSSDDVSIEIQTLPRYAALNSKKYCILPSELAHQARCMLLRNVEVFALSGEPDKRLLVLDREFCDVVVPALKAIWTNKDDVQSFPTISVTNAKLLEEVSNHLRLFRKIKGNNVTFPPHFSAEWLDERWTEYLPVDIDELLEVEHVVLKIDVNLPQQLRGVACSKFDASNDIIRTYYALKDGVATSFPIFPSLWMRVRGFNFAREEAVHELKTLLVNSQCHKRLIAYDKADEARIFIALTKYIGRKDSISSFAVFSHKDLEALSKSDVAVDILVLSDRSLKFMKFLRSLDNDPYKFSYILFASQVNTSTKIDEMKGFGIIDVIPLLSPVSVTKTSFDLFESVPPRDNVDMSNLVEDSKNWIRGNYCRPPWSVVYSAFLLRTKYTRIYAGHIESDGTPGFRRVAINKKYPGSGATSLLHDLSTYFKEQNWSCFIAKDSFNAQISQNQIVDDMAINLTNNHEVKKYLFLFDENTIVPSQQECLLAFQPFLDNGLTIVLVEVCSWKMKSVVSEKRISSIDPFLEKQEALEVIQYWNSLNFGAAVSSALTELRDAIMSSKPDRDVRHIHVLMYAVTEGKFVQIRTFIKDIHDSLDEDTRCLAFLLAAKSIERTSSARSLSRTYFAVKKDHISCMQELLTSPSTAESPVVSQPIRFKHPYFGFVYCDLFLGGFRSKFILQLDQTITRAFDLLLLSKELKEEIVYAMFFLHYDAQRYSDFVIFLLNREMLVETDLLDLMNMDVIKSFTKEPFVNIAKSRIHRYLNSCDAAIKFALEAKKAFLDIGSIV